MREIATSDYWDKRVKSSDNLQDILFLDPRRDAYWSRVRNFLELFKDKSALDVCCGWGQFSDIFSDYIGVDISQEMLKIASSRNPEKEYLLTDILNEEVEGSYDIIFEVNSLHSLGLSPEEFYEKFKGNARLMVACLECDKFTIFQNYGR